jgi:hypothetical protein
MVPFRVLVTPFVVCFIAIGDEATSRFFSIPHHTLLVLKKMPPQTIFITLLKC